MKRLLISFILALFASFTPLTPAYAGGISSNAVVQAGFDNLTDEQKADVIKQIAQSQTSTPIAAQATPQKIGEWVDLGTKIGQMMGGAAKEVGIAVNDFVKTPVGQWTMAMIIWKFMGSVIIHVFGGLLVLTVGLSIILFFSRRLRTCTIVYDPERKDLFGRSAKVKATYTEMDGETVGALMAASGAIMLVSLGVIFTF